MHLVSKSQETPGYSFWDDSGAECCSFQHSCNYQDWANILKAVARNLETSSEHISQDKAFKKTKYLDIGSGFTHNIREIISILKFEHKILSNWDCYEPDTAVADIVSRKTVSQNRHPLGINNIFTDIAQFADSYDSILFMHSSYYVDDFEKTLLNLKDKLNGGSIIVLRVAEHSPFYLFDEQIPRNGSYSEFTKLGFSVESEYHKVAIDIPEEMMSSSTFMRQMYLFFFQGDTTLVDYERFRKKFQRIYSGKIDLVDEILLLK